MKKHKLLARIAAGIVIACGGSLSSAHAIIGESLSISPFIAWKEISTEHFRITYPSRADTTGDMAAIAKTAAKHLEDAHRVLSPILKWTPATRTQVVLLDNTDAANGLASAAGRLGMVLNITPPDPSSSLGYYDDWLKILCVHEYTHFLNIDTTRDFWGVLRIIFGDIVVPNGLWYPWMLEGLAVYNETRFTTAGRGRGPFYEMILRAAVEAGVLGTRSFVTIDRMTLDWPYAPGGEAAYLFGYQMMNRIAQSSGDAALGELSWRSGGRVPFFINGNLENITQKDWYTYWNEWASDTRTRMQRDLKKLTAQPLTPLEPLSAPAITTLGPVVSPDGRWLAYTQSSSDQRFGLWLRSMTGAGSARSTARRLGDKLSGSQMAFTPDSQTLIHNSLRRSTEWGLYSDLAATEVESGKTYWISRGGRAKDPDVAPNGKWVTFTLTDTGRTRLVAAPLIRDASGRYRLGRQSELVTPQIMQRISNPRFSPDGRSIAYSVHLNQGAHEEIHEVQFDPASVKPGASRIVVSNGFLNRFPSYDFSGNLVYVSNATGVDTAYRQPRGAAPATPPQPIVNVTTALWFPTFYRDPAQKEMLLGLTYRYDGWRVVTTPAANLQTYRTSDLSVGPPPAPVPAASSSAYSSEKISAERDYSVFPSLWPRAWSPILLSSYARFQIGGAVSGFDAVDRHRYAGVFAYDTKNSSLEGGIVYSNRLLGPDLQISAQSAIESWNLGNPTATELLNYVRKDALGVDLSFKFDWTWSSLTPSFSFDLEQLRYYLRSTTAASGASGFSQYAQSRAIPQLTAGLAYSDAEFSPLAITAEGGRTSSLTSRLYLDQGRALYKWTAKHREFFHLGSHIVMIPSIKGQWATRDRYSYILGLATTEGRSQSLLDSVGSDEAARLVARGYPGIQILSRASTAAALDFVLPVARIFGGWGTNPAYLDNLALTAFGERTQFHGFTTSAARTLHAVGAGLRLGSELFRIPLNFGVEYHMGFETLAGGRKELFVDIRAPAVSF